MHNVINRLILLSFLWKLLFDPYKCKDSCETGEVKIKVKPKEAKVWGQ